MTVAAGKHVGKTLENGVCDRGIARAQYGRHCHGAAYDSECGQGEPSPYAGKSLSIAKELRDVFTTLTNQGEFLVAAIRSVVLSADSDD